MFPKSNTLLFFLYSLLCHSLMDAKHILITGLPGVGKTTLVQKICLALTEKGIPIAGFYTEELRNPSNVRIGFDVVTLDGKKGRLARTNETSFYKVGNYAVFPTEFENIVLPLFQKQVKGILVLDEIGKMEMFSEAFKQNVADAFKNRSVRVLATIPVARGRGIPFVEDLRRNPSCRVVTVDRSNRNSLLNIVVADLLK